MPAKKTKDLMGEVLEDFMRALASACKVFGNTYTDRRRARHNKRQGKHTREQWDALKVKYDFTCLRCHRREPEIRLTRDHINPRGSDYIENIQPLCVHCNDLKGDQTIDYRPPGNY